MRQSDLGYYAFELTGLRVWHNIDAPIAIDGWDAKLFKPGNRAESIENESLYDAWNTFILVEKSGVIIPYSYIPSDIQTAPEKMALFTIAATKKGLLFYQVISLEANSPLPKQVAADKEVANKQGLEQDIKDYAAISKPPLPASLEYGACCTCNPCMMREFMKAAALYKDSLKKENPPKVK